MMKKMRVSMEPSSSSCFPGGEGARVRFKHQLLLQDYQELLKETEENKKRMKKELNKKHMLLSEVRFLRWKYQQLSNAQTDQVRTKKRSQKLPSSARKAPPMSAASLAVLPLMGRNHKAKEVSPPNTTALLDLNKVFLPNGEEMEGYEVEWKPLNVDNLKKLSVGGDALGNDVKLSICRDAGHGSKRLVKRKVSVPDQMALRV